MHDQAPEALNPEQAAKLAGIGRTAVYLAMGSGDLPSFKIGKRRLVRRESVTAWLARLEARAVANGHGLKAPASGPAAAA